MSEDEQKEVVEDVIEWMNEAKHEVFVSLGKGMLKWANALQGNQSQKAWNWIAADILRIADQDGVMLHKDKQRIISRLINEAASHGVKVHRIWMKKLQHNNHKINFELSQAVSELSRKGDIEDRRAWERLLAAHAHPLIARTSTSVQTANIVIGGVEARQHAETVVVWNGNGLRARWAEKSELREVVSATNPDVLCFLESKTNVEKMLELKDFEIWMRKAGFRHAYYWSARSDSKSHGNEGVLVLSKVTPKLVRYGMGMAKYDQQARVMSLEFDD